MIVVCCLFVFGCSLLCVVVRCVPFVGCYALFVVACGYSVLVCVCVVSCRLLVVDRCCALLLLVCLLLVVIGVVFVVCSLLLPCVFGSLLFCFVCC